MKPSKTKRCPECGKRKRRDAFYEDRKRVGALHTYCKECCKRRASDLYARSDKKLHRDRHRAWVAANKEHLRSYKVANALGVPVADVKAVLARGKCDICGSDDARCVDHCHRRGSLRGLLCHACNKGLGFFVDDPARLRRAADYVS